MKVCMLPTAEQAASDTSNAINQIVLRLQARLPAYGVELVNSPDQADLVVGHAGQTLGIKNVDVAHCHGLYPTASKEETLPWHYSANREVIYNLINSRAVTVPSEWVADIIRRDMHINPTVIGWAVEPEDWKDTNNQGYVLWNKTRPEGVCTPKWMNALAAQRGDISFISTFGESATNVKIVGRQPFKDMQRYIKNAGVYLATTKETFGIGTLEAMACGVPILGFNHGGTANIVQHGVTGYLVTPGDMKGLTEGLEYCIQHRVILGENAKKVASRYTWDAVAKSFAELYRATLENKPYKYKVSVVIPCHNYAKFIPQAIASVIGQKTSFPVELICVNDSSTDDSRKVINGLLEDVENSQYFEVGFGNPADSRNYGVKNSHGEYVVCLDADDRIGNENFLQTLAAAFEQDRSLGIVFTGLRVMDVDGNLSPNKSGWPMGFDYEQQLVRHNQVPTCCMFRKTAWDRAGGYRRRYVPAEDAELWTRMGSLGFGAKHVVDDGWFEYRMHSESLSKEVRTQAKPEPNWIDKVWITNGKRPFACIGAPPNGTWPVRNYDQPVVSIVVPVSPSHIELLKEALDSIENQSETNWECIVVNDCPYDIELPGHPWARIINTGGNKGAGFARNLGVKNAKASLIAFLDADDWMLSKFLELTLRAAMRVNFGRYIYTDWYSLNKQGIVEAHECPEYSPQDMFMKSSVHSINVLIRKDLLESVGGFDENMPAWEDTDIFMNLAAAGICGMRVPEKLIVYRYTTGSLREKGEVVKEGLLNVLRAKYADYISGGKMCSCNDLAVKPVNAPLSTFSQPSVAGDMVRIEYQGYIGTVSVIGPATRQPYGRRSGGDIFYVYIKDQQADPEHFMVLPEPSPMQVGDSPRLSEPPKPIGEAA